MSLQRLFNNFLSDSWWKYGYIGESLNSSTLSKIPKLFSFHLEGTFKPVQCLFPLLRVKGGCFFTPLREIFTAVLPDTSVKDRQVALLARIPCTLLRFKRFQTTVDWWSVARSFERMPARALRDPFSSKKGGFPIRWWFLFTNDKERCPNSLIFKYSLLVLRKWKSRKRREEEDGVEEDPREF